MAKTKMQMPDGTMAEAEELELEIVSEPWCVYKLEDGTTLRVRPLVNKVLRLDMHNPDGDPVYQVMNQLQVRAQVPKSLKKFAKFEKPSNQEVA